MINSDENTHKTEQIKSDIQKSEHQSTHITKNEETKEQQIININNYNYSDQNAIIISFDQDKYLFSVYNVEKKFLGNFSSNDVIKFVTNKIYPNFFSTIGSDLNFPLVKQYVCDIVFVEDNLKIKLLNYLESPFMANIEMIINLYKGVLKSSSIIKLELEKIQDTYVKSQVAKILKQLSYVILTYTLRLISQISESIKDDPAKTDLKNYLLRQSVMIVYKIDTFMRDEIDEKIGTYKILQNDLVRIGELKIEMYKKINDLEKKISDQSVLLNSLDSKLKSIIDNPFTHSENISSQSNAITFNTQSSTSSDFEFHKNSQSQTLSADTNNSSYMFHDSDCNFTESGDAQHCVDYLSPKK